MKTKSFIFAAGASVLLVNPLVAAPQDSQQMFYNMLLYAMLGVALLLLLVVFYLYKLVETLGGEMNRTAETAEIEKAYESRSFWEKVFALNPESFEKKLTLNHSYDGIHELDNPTPPWFNFLFYGTIVFGIAYMIVYHVVGDGNIQETEYKQEVAVATALQEELMKKTANAINESNVKVLTDAKTLADGKALYDKNCIACHLANGGGSVGPNLTDGFWIHGNTPKALYHTISEGVLEKGMIAWKKQLNPAQIQSVISYIVTLQGTNPAGGKEPQGTNDGFTNQATAPAPAPAPAPDSSTTDSTTKLVMNN